MGRHIFSTQCQCWQMWEFQSFKKTFYTNYLCIMYTYKHSAKVIRTFYFDFVFIFLTTKKKMWKRNSKSQKHCKIICEIIVPPPNIFAQFYKSSMPAVCVMWWEPNPMNFPRSCIIAKKSHMILQNKFKLSLW